MACNGDPNWISDFSFVTKCCHSESKLNDVSSKEKWKKSLFDNLSDVLFIRPYPPVRFPSPYSTRLPSKVNIPTRNRIERFSVNKLNHMAFLERSKAFRKNDNILASIVCENRYLCELGSIAVDEENATKSAHTLYKALWRLPNE